MLLHDFYNWPPALIARAAATGRIRTSSSSGRTLAEVRDAAGHASIATTSIYTHVAVQDDGEPGDLFDF